MTTFIDVLLARIDAAHARGDVDELRRLAIAGVTDYRAAVAEWDALERRVSA